MIDWPVCCVCVYVCVHVCIAFEPTFATSCGLQERGQGVENGEPCHVFMLTNELITQPLIYLTLCHFTGMLQQSNACRLWVISWQLKANYYSSNSSAHQALNHKCCSLSFCRFTTVLKWGYGIKTHFASAFVLLQWCLLAFWLYLFWKAAQIYTCECAIISWFLWCVNNLWSKNN